MKIVTEKSFDRDYARLPRNIQERVDKQLSLLFANPHHGSLQIRKMRGQADIWEARVSLLLSALSACIALGLVYLALPPFSAYVQENLALNSGLILWILGITLFVGLLSGSYPALYLSAFDPATVLKGGAIKAGSAQARVRKGLVVLQFAISIILIIGTIIVADQMRLIRKKDLGFNKDEVVVASIFRQDRYQSDGIGMTSARDKYSARHLSLRSSSRAWAYWDWRPSPQNSAQKK